MSLDTIYYQSRVVTASVNAFLMNLAEAVAIVIGLLMVFMGWQSGLLIGITLILTILATLIGMFIMGIDLQKISLGALILALGMLVDNAIVIIENIYRYMQQGVPRVEAAMRATGEVAWPVIGSTLTTVAAFFPMIFWPGIMGEFMKYLPITLIVTLASSLFVALVINPALCAFS